MVIHRESNTVHELRVLPNDDLTFVECRWLHPCPILLAESLVARTHHRPLLDICGPNFIGDFVEPCLDGIIEILGIVHICWIPQFMTVVHKGIPLFSEFSAEATPPVAETLDVQPSCPVCDFLIQGQLNHYKLEKLPSFLHLPKEDFILLSRIVNPVDSLLAKLLMFLGLSTLRCCHHPDEPIVV